MASKDYSPCWAGPGCPLLCMKSMLNAPTLGVCFGVDTRKGWVKGVTVRLCYPLILPSFLFLISHNTISSSHFSIPRVPNAENGDLFSYYFLYQDTTAALSPRLSLTVWGSPRVVWEGASGTVSWASDLMLAHVVISALWDRALH